MKIYERREEIQKERVFFNVRWIPANTHTHIHNALRKANDMYIIYLQLRTQVTCCIHDLESTQSVRLKHAKKEAPCIHHHHA